MPPQLEKLNLGVFLWKVIPNAAAMKDMTMQNAF